MDVRGKITAHLVSYGINQFASEDEYFAWAGEKVGQRRAMKLNDWMDVLASSPKHDEIHEFYDFIAHPIVSSAVCSGKANAIAESGRFVFDHLPESGTVLDVGCAFGYLTLFYAMKSELQVTGCDFSLPSIARARREARERSLDNVSFVTASVIESVPKGPFDAILSTQVIGRLSDRDATLGLIASELADDGVLISVEDLGTAKEAKLFIQAAEAHGLYLHEFQMIFFEDHGNKGAYPAMIFKKSSDCIRPNIRKEYSAALRRL